MQTNPVGTNSQQENGTHEAEELKWSELSPSVQEMVLARIQSLKTEVEVEIADNHVRQMVLAQTMAKAFKAAADQDGSVVDMAPVMGAMQNEIAAGSEADQAILHAALCAAYEHLLIPEGTEKESVRNQTTVDENWHLLCGELSLDPNTATPEDVLVMVRRLKARSEPTT